MPRLVEGRHPALGGYAEEGLRDPELGCASPEVGGSCLPVGPVSPDLCCGRPVPPPGGGGGQEVPAWPQSRVGRGRESM